MCICYITHSCLCFAFTNHNDVKSKKKSIQRSWLQPKVSITNKLLHKILGFLSQFLEQSDFWISQNPLSKFTVEQESAHFSAQPKTANSAQISDKDYNAITFFAIICHQSYVKTFLQKSKFGNMTNYDQEKLKIASCSKHSNCV